MATIDSHPQLTHQLREVLTEIMVLPRRLSIDTTSAEFELPRLRGVWGAALHALDRQAYDIVFKPPGDRDVPGYVMRPVLPWTADCIRIDFILIGNSVRFDQSALRAWDIASGMGIGADRDWFVVRDRRVLGPHGEVGTTDAPWPLSAATWGGADDLPEQACSLRFETPVCLQMRKQLIERPKLTDIVAKGCRRVGEFLPHSVSDNWRQIKAELIELSKQVPASAWRVRPDDEGPVGLKRYSGSQRREFVVPGVQGSIHLPEGPASLWPLLAALSWIHVGKSTNVGLGWLGRSPSNSTRSNPRRIAKPRRQPR